MTYQRIPLPSTMEGNGKQSSCSAHRATPMRNGPPFKLSSFSSVATLLLFFIAALLGVAMSLPRPASAMSVIVEPRSTFCVRESMTQETAMRFWFESFDKENRQVDVTLKDGEGKHIFSWKNALSDKHNIAPEAAPKDPKKGRVVVACFENRAMLGRKRIAFHFVKESGYFEEMGEEGKPGTTKVDPIRRQMDVLSKGMQNLVDLQRSLQIQQREHRDTVESANNYLHLWVIFQFIAILVSALGQLFFLKRFISKRGRY